MRIQRLMALLLGATLLLTACGGAESRDAADGGGATDAAGAAATDGTEAPAVDGDEPTAAAGATDAEDDAATDDAAAPAGDGGTLAVVTSDPIGVNQFLLNAVEGAEAAAEENGLDIQVFETADPSQLESNVLAAVDLDPVISVMVGFQLADALAREAAAAPDQQFVFVDACLEEPLPNVTCVQFREHEGVFLAGAEAAYLDAGETGAFGAVVVLDSPRFRRFSEPFGAGAQLVDEDASFEQLFVGGNAPFSDPARAKEQALTLAGRDITYIMASAAAGNFGIFEAAAEEDLRVWGVDTNQCPDGEGYVVDNVVKRLDTAIPQAVAQVLGGSPGGELSLGLAEDGVSLTGLLDGVEDSGCLIADHPDVIEQVSALRDQIISGEVEVADPLHG